MHLCRYICLAHFSIATEQRDSCHLAEHFYGCNFPLFWGHFESTRRANFFDASTATRKSCRFIYAAAALFTHRHKQQLQDVKE